MTFHAVDCIIVNGHFFEYVVEYQPIFNAFGNNVWWIFVELNCCLDWLIEGEIVKRKKRCREKLTFLPLWLAIGCELVKASVYVAARCHWLCWCLHLLTCSHFRYPNIGQVFCAVHRHHCSILVPCHHYNHMQCADCDYHHALVTLNGYCNREVVVALEQPSFVFPPHKSHRWHFEFVWSVLY